MPKKAVWIAALLALYPRLGDSYTHLLSSQFREAMVAHQDTSIRLHHARELLGKNYAQKVPRGFHAEYDVAPYVYLITRQRLAGRCGRNAQALADAIVAEARHYRLDPVFLLAVIQKESRFFPRKVGSHAEIGLMQIKPDTGEWVARKFHLPWNGPATLFDPIMNVRIGAAYFSFLRKSFKQRGILYLAAYNLGQQKIRENLKHGIYPHEYPTEVVHNFLHLHAEMGRLARRKHLRPHAG